MFKWLKQRKIKKLLTQRAGLYAYDRTLRELDEVCPETRQEIAEVEERLRQLGWLSDKERQEQAAAHFKAQEVIRKAFHDQEVKRG